MVVAHSYGGVNELNEKVLDAVHGRVGAEEVPDVFASYADTAYDQQHGQGGRHLPVPDRGGAGRYVTSYLDEGRFEEGAGFQIFPIAKATELLFLNETAWEEFSTATGTGEDALTTWGGRNRRVRGLLRLTDGQDPSTPDDGRAFFGRDAFANYIIIGQHAARRGAVPGEGRQGHAECGRGRHAPPVGQLLRALRQRLVHRQGPLPQRRHPHRRPGCLRGSSSGASFFTSEVTQRRRTYPIVGACAPS